MKYWSRTGAFMMFCAVALSTSYAMAPAPAVAEMKSVTVFIEPGVSDDAVWMALAKDLYKAEGLDVQIRLFPSGTTALQTFKAGAGDIVFTGDLPALQYWQRGAPYRVIAPIERDAKGYAAIVTNAIKSPKDLVGKSIATRVGSTGSYFVSEYLRKNGIDEKTVRVRNLDPPQMPPALCRGDIDGFFIWEPAPTQAKKICSDKVHYLTTAEGYMMGYNLIGARPDWLAKPEGADIAERFLRATRKGAVIAATDEKGEIADLKQRFGLSESETVAQRNIMQRVLKFDAEFFADFCSENRWQERAGLQNGPSDLSKWVWPEGLMSIDPKLVVAAPPPC
jgi:ABC-type nitrate/sulfonate/bicarbonate transport system substrate-binding protein